MGLEKGGAGEARSTGGKLGLTTLLCYFEKLEEELRVIDGVTYLLVCSFLSLSLSCGMAVV